jgi:Carbamoyltransferase C-terminus
MRIVRINAVLREPVYERSLIGPRSPSPTAITHVDYSARLQTVRCQTNQTYHDVIEAFYRRTGCPVILNTSFNVRGEPIVCAPEDAYRCFMRTISMCSCPRTSFSKRRCNRQQPTTANGVRSSCSIEERELGWHSTTASSLHLVTTFD